MMRNIARWSRPAPGSGKRDIRAAARSEHAWTEPQAKAEDLVTAACIGIAALTADPEKPAGHASRAELQALPGAAGPGCLLNQAAATMRALQQVRPAAGPLRMNGRRR